MEQSGRVQRECAYDIINEKYGYDVTQGADNGDTDDDVVEVNGIVDMTDKVEELLRKRSQKSYFSKDIICKGIVTGVETKFLGPIRLRDKNYLISCGAAFTDAESEALAFYGERTKSDDYTQAVSGFCAVQAETVNIPGNSDVNGIAAIEDEIAGITKKRRGGTAKKSWRCSICEQAYSIKAHFDVHVKNCEPPPIGGCTIQRAFLIAHSMIFEEQSIRIYTRNERNPALGKVQFDPATDCWIVKRGFARRPKWVDALGENTVEMFKPQIKEWFTIRAVEPSKKMTSNRMQK